MTMNRMYATIARHISPMRALPPANYNKPESLFLIHLASCRATSKIRPAGLASK